MSRVDRQQAEALTQLIQSKVNELITAANRVRKKFRLPELNHEMFKAEVKYLLTHLNAYCSLKAFGHSVTISLTHTSNYDIEVLPTIVFLSFLAQELGVISQAKHQLQFVEIQLTRNPLDYPVIIFHFPFAHYKNYTITIHLSPQKTTSLECETLQDALETLMASIITLKEG